MGIKLKKKIGEPEMATWLVQISHLTLKIFPLSLLFSRLLALSSLHQTWPQSFLVTSGTRRCTRGGDGFKGSRNVETQGGRVLDDAVDGKGCTWPIAIDLANNIPPPARRYVPWITFPGDSESDPRGDE